jgi:hypothetical protein
MSSVRQKTIQAAGLTLLLFLFSLCVSLAAAEMLVRYLGFRPSLPARNQHYENEPAMHEPNSLLGWRPKEGNYRYPPYWGDEDDIQITILPNGRR